MKQEQRRCLDKTAEINKKLGEESPEALWRKSYLYFLADIGKGLDTVLKKLEGNDKEHQQMLRGLNTILGNYKRHKTLIKDTRETSLGGGFEELLLGITKREAAEKAAKEYFKKSGRFDKHKERAVELFIKYLSAHPTYLVDAIRTIKGTEK